MGSLGRDEIERDTFQNKRISPSFTLNLTLGHRWQCATSHCLSEERRVPAAQQDAPVPMAPSFTLWKICLVKPAGLFPEWEGLHATLLISPSGCAPWPSKPGTPRGSASNCPGVSFQLICSTRRSSLKIHPDIFCISEPLNSQARQ